MPTRPNDRPELTPEERGFVEKLSEHYAPAPMSGAQRASFDAAIRRRIREREDRAMPGRWIWIPSGGLATATAALLIWLQLPGGVAPLDTPAEASPSSSVTEIASIDPSWEAEVLYGEDSGGQAQAATDLPPEYAAIDTLFFEDELFGG